MFNESNFYFLREYSTQNIYKKFSESVEMILRDAIWSVVSLVEIKSRIGAGRRIEPELSSAWW